MDQADRPAQAVFGHVVDALMRGNVVPFVGAGISVWAKVDNCPDCPNFSPTISWLCTRLLGQLKQKSLQEDERTFSRMAEIVLWQKGPDGLCKALALDNFTRLRPQPAHYAIAALALEGIIEEVISTNWDTCIEDAVRELSSGARDLCRPVTSLAQYRKGRCTADASALLLYKINGCAEGYKPSKRLDDERELPVVTTERQLQDFGKRQWARDLLRDRARSRVLLFSGFGSDEPQVRHTVLQLMEEFSQDDGCTEHKLFVVAYEQSLSFNQRQILRAFVRANGKPAKEADNTPEDGVPSYEKQILEHALMGSDAHYFGASGSELPADNFWCAAFEACIEKLLRTRYAAQGGALATWLDQWSPEPERTRRRFLDWLFPPEKREKSAFHCPVPGLLGPHPEDPTGGFRLMGWIKVMDGDRGKMPRYLPFRDQKRALLPIATLLILYLLSGGDLPLCEFVKQIDENSEYGLRVRLVDARSAQSGGIDTTDATDVRLITRTLANQMLLPGEAQATEVQEALSRLATESRLLVVIVVPESVGRTRPSRACEIRGDRMRMLRVWQIEAHELLKLREIGRRGWGVLAHLVAESSGPKTASRRLRREAHDVQS